MTSRRSITAFALVATAGILSGCVIPPPGSANAGGKVYASKHCEKATGSLVCSNDPDGPETGDGLTQPGVGLFNTHVPGS